MIRVYKYGLRAPSDLSAKLVRNQLVAAHQYRNTLVQIERLRRGEIRDLEATYGNIQELMAVAEAADKEAETAAVKLRQAKSKLHADRTRDTAKDSGTKRRTKEEIAARKASAEATKDEITKFGTELREARAKVTAAIKALREARVALRENESYKLHYARIEAKAKELFLSARKYCGVFWGTYLLIEDEMQKSRGMPLYDRTTANDPRFKTYTGTGRVGVQLQGGLKADELFLSDTRVQVDPLPKDASNSLRRESVDLTRIGKRQHTYTTLRVRVGSQGRAPIWASFPLGMHRPMHESAVIKWAVVRVQKVGSRERWSVQFSVEENSPGQNGRPAVPGVGDVALDLGWRVVDGGLRVCMAVGEDGERHELILPHRIIRSLEKSNSLRSIRDRNFDAIRAQFETRAKEHIEKHGPLPDWLAERVQYMSRWKSQARFASVLVMWRYRRFEHDEALFTEFNDWRKHDKHLWLWESAAREHFIQARLKLYEGFAAKLANKYACVVIEDFDLRPLAKRKITGADNEVINETARTNRQIAAVSELRRVCVNAATMRGKEVEKVPARDTTRICPHCGVVERFDAEASIMRRCGECGMEHDQDVSADQVMLKLVAQQRIERALEAKKKAAEKAAAIARGEKPEEDAKKKSRWVKRKAVDQQSAA